MISRYIFKNVKKIIPRISSTELIALKSGDTSIDKDILSGNVDFKLNPIILENKFPEKKIENLISKYGNDFIFPSIKTKNIFDFLGKNKFFSFIIDEKFNGTNLSVNEMSNVLTKITSVNPSLGVTVMVPNSLGPGELLQHYGTEGQKNKYLTGLANGDYIPCFGLTGPTNGSDATGTIDEGIVVMEDGKKKIKLSINKRYITLAPVSNLIGLAFNLKDPYELLDKGSEGVTVALIESNEKGLLKNTYHNPLNVGFPNGTLKGSLEIDVDKIIGGEKMAGNGWKMLMECLAAGRGICLPATANASSKVATFGILNYAKHRTQFKMPLIKMEGVQEKIVNIVFNTWLIHTSIKLTNTILDSGKKPSVISAIMKQQTTDRGRDVLNDAMDIHAGGSICIGESNFLEKFYRSAPIGITVEGSNTLTKNLIIFGQGLNKSHPHISNVLDSILENNQENFNKHFKDIVKFSIGLYFKSLKPTYNTNIENRFHKQVLDFATLTNFIALKGGSIKSEQFLSCDMADIFSNLYLAYSVLWHEKHFKINTKLTDFCVDKLLNENQTKINRVIDNQDFIKYLLKHLKKKESSVLYENKRVLIDEIINSEKFINEITDNIIIKNTILEDLDKLNNYKKESNEYKELLKKVINVGEYDIPNCS